jgi:hypothetical protein
LDYNGILINYFKNLSKYNVSGLSDDFGEIKKGLNKKVDLILLETSSIPRGFSKEAEYLTIKGHRVYWQKSIDRFN